MIRNSCVASRNTSWNHVASWYDELLKEEGTYQKEVILPNLLRLADIKKGERIADIACGNGFFAREFSKKGAEVIAVDISPELITCARKNSPQKIRFEIAPAYTLPIKEKTIDKAVIILSIQNIEDVSKTFKEINRVLAPSGKFFLVMNHPAFRIPQNSGWGWDEKIKTQYRRIDRYLTESKIKINMHPGVRQGAHTLSFHRPLQFYFKTLHNQGFAVSRLEEWTSNKKSQPGPRAKAEDNARKEIPVFLFMEAIKIV